MIFSNQSIIAKKLINMKEGSPIRNNIGKRYAMARENMVADQIASRGIKNTGVLEAMGKVPREIFVPSGYRECAYEDRPLPIGMGQTISQPYIVALMTESLELDDSMEVLEIGTGSGYQSAILSVLARKVYSVEIKKDLFERTRKILAEYPNIEISNHDGSKGWEKYAPYDRIIVTAAPDQIPHIFMDQLKEEGILVIPVGSSRWDQELYKIIKTPKGTKKIKICNVAFVPLTGKITV